MAERKQNPFVYKDSFKVLQQNMEILFNNVKYSDTTFIVNQRKFHALSQLVCVSSATLDALISAHVAHCTDKEIKISDVKNEQSFSIILRYVYGLDINFTEMNISILCEILNLSEVYQLAEFTEGLKQYLSKIDCFNMDSLAVLLNTAKKFNLTDLYERLSIYAYLHADVFVSHESIKDLQYDVLLDLLKSNWFCTSEISVLRGLLHWHSDMYKKKDSGVSDNKTVHPSNGEDAEDLDLSDKKQTDGSDFEFLAESVSSFDEGDDELAGDNLTLETASDSKENVEPSSSHTNGTERHPDTDVSDNEKAHSDVVKSFSENVLKSLIMHIRVKQISMFEFIQAFKTGLFKKYKTILLDDQLFSQNSEPRRRYVAIASERSEELAQQSRVKLETLADIKKVFTAEFPQSYNELHESKESLNWNICLKLVKCENNTDNYYLDVYLQFKSEKQRDWTCSADCQLTLVSHNANLPNLVLPGDGAFKSVTFTPNRPHASLGRFYRDSNEWYRAYYASPKYVFMFELLFKTIQIKE